MIAFWCTLLIQDSYDDFKRQAIKKEDEGAWKKIDWQKNIAVAMEKGKPILAVLVVGEMGKKGAAEC